MTKEEFLEIMNDIELVTGQDFSDEFLAGRFDLVKNLDVERFRAAILESISTGKDPFSPSGNHDHSPE